MIKPIEFKIEIFKVLYDYKITLLQSTHNENTDFFSTTQSKNIATITDILKYITENKGVNWYFQTENITECFNHDKVFVDKINLLSQEYSAFLPTHTTNTHYKSQ